MSWQPLRISGSAEGRQPRPGLAETRATGLVVLAPPEDPAGVGGTVPSKMPFAFRELIRFGSYRRRVPPLLVLLPLGANTNHLISDQQGMLKG